MMGREWAGILRRYGQEVTVRRGDTSVQVRAFLQEVEEDEQLVPSPLGMRREERAVYFGPADVPLIPRESAVEWKGRAYEVRAAREVGDGHHIRAVLRRMEDEA